MKKNLLFTLLLPLIHFSAFSQCELMFGSTPNQFNFSYVSGSDIVNGASSGANDSSTQSFDIWDEVNDDCSTPGGANDITFDFEIIHAFDQYSVDGIIDAFAGSTHDITQSTSGLRGNIPLGNSSTNESSTADVRGYKITVTFADHVILTAGDIGVNLTSVNTAGEAHESSSLVFLDDSGTPYGTATYDGYYSGSTGASTDGTCTSPAVNTNSWSTSGTGVYIAASTVNTDITDPCNPIAGSDGAANNGDVNPVTNADLNVTDPIGGFVFTVYLEDVAASTAPGAETTTATQFTSTLNGIDIAGNPLPVELAYFRAALEDDEVFLSWATLSEENNEGFEIEWSTDGSQFEMLDFVAGQGTYHQAINYDFTHKNPTKGDNYYRLKQLDFDGKFSYSNIRAVNIKGQSTVSVFPTIASSYITVLKPESINVSDVLIFDVHRTVVKSIRDNSDREIQIDLQNLPTGNYYVRTIAKGIIQTDKIVVVKQ